MTQFRWREFCQGLVLGALSLVPFAYGGQIVLFGAGDLFRYGGLQGQLLAIAISVAVGYWLAGLVRSARSCGWLTGLTALLILLFGDDLLHGFWNGCCRNDSEGSMVACASVAAAVRLLLRGGAWFVGQALAHRSQSAPHGQAVPPSGCRPLESGPEAGSL